MKNVFSKLKTFLNSWTGTIIFVIFFTSFVAQSFLIPSGSMKNTQLIGEFLIAKKFSYGLPIPRLPLVNLPLMPDIFGNGHLIEGDRPKREDIVIFLYPKDNKTNYVKRCVAVGDDELIYMDKKLLIHFHEGDEYIKANYDSKKIVSINSKLWVENPYMTKYPGIGYRVEQASVFEHLLNRIAHNGESDMKPIYIESIQAPIYTVQNKKVNALYTKVPKEHYYMIGDNRDNSNDSRFWGAVPYKNIVGKPWFVWFSMEHRSYEQVLNGDEHGSGRDHANLNRVCKDVDLVSKECEILWSKERFHIRWERLGRSVDWLQRQDFEE